MTNFTSVTSVPLQIVSCNIGSVLQAKPIAKILTEIAVADKRGNRLVILLLNTKRQLMTVIRDYSEMPFFKREETALCDRAGQRNR